MNQGLDTTNIANVAGILAVIRKNDPGRMGAPDPAHVVNQKVWNEVLEHFKASGRFLRDQRGNSLYLDEVRSKVIRMHPGDPELRLRLRQLKLLPREPHTRMVEDALVDYAARAKKQTVEMLSFMNKKRDGLYINLGRGQMLRITAGQMEVVPVGTDEVVLLDPEERVWPSYEEVLKPLIDEITQVVRSTCTELIPELPLTRHVTTRWSTSSKLRVEQMHQLFITRLMLMFSAASEVSLWPIVMLSGDQNSGKSTPGEKLLTLLAGEKTQGDLMSDDRTQLETSAANTPILLLDNVDGADLDSKKNGSTLDLLCLIATGGSLARRKLFTTADQARYRIHTHLITTSRTLPTDRADVQRRTLSLEVDSSPKGAARRSKDELFGELLEDRPRILAEIIVRSQNILRAYQQPAPDIDFISEMPEYEAFTYRCAVFEGTLAETQALWLANKEQYQEAITEQSPIVFALRLLIGKLGGGIKQIKVAELHSAMKTAFASVDLPLPFSAANRLGTHLQQSIPAIATLGVTTRRVGPGRDVFIKPSAEQIAECVAMYEGLRRDYEERSLGPMPANRRKADYFAGVPLQVDDASRHEDLSDLM